MPVPYHPRYCEENAWHLCRADGLGLVEAHVVVISNPRRRVAMWMQKAAPADAPIGWDYHVIVVARDRGWNAWDPDSRLGMPVPLAHYLEHSFASLGVQPVSFDPRFRIIAAEDYRSQLRSDRSHMRHADGSWHAPPPPWPPLSEPGAGSNLEQLIDMSDGFLGTLVDLTGLLERFPPG